MKNMHWAALLLCIPMTFIALASCGSDESNQNSVDGGSGQGGVGGGDGAAGTTGSTWEKGVVGTSTGVIALAKNAGNIQGISLTEKMMKTMDLPMNDAGETDVEPLPQTAPVIDGDELGE